MRLNSLNTAKLRSLAGGSIMSKKRILGIFIIFFVVILLALLLKISISSTTNALSYDSRVTIPGAKKTTNIEKEYVYPLINSKGEEVSRFRIYLQTAELRDQIVVQGKKATSVKGRTFLIINLKVTNEFDKAIEVNTGDYIRLSVNGNESEWLAPDIHNDPVKISAISTKYTRVGFPINDTDTNIKLRVGEINGEKETLDINF